MCVYSHVVINFSVVWGGCPYFSTQLDGFTRILKNLVTNRYSKSLEQSAVSY